MYQPLTGDKEEKGSIPLYYGSEWENKGYSNP
jgi:hypothetical protein